MSSTSSKHTPTPQAPESLEESFRRLAADWHNAVAFHSSSTVRTSHPANLEIICMREDVVPLLLRDLQDNHTHRFATLRQITQTNPIPESAAGNLPKMVEAWLQWAKDKGYQW